MAMVLELWALKCLSRGLDQDRNTSRPTLLGRLLHWRFNRDVARILVLYFPHGIIKLVRARANLVCRQPCLPIYQDRAPKRQLLLEPRQIFLLANLTHGHNNHLLPWIIVITCSVTGISLALERDCSKTFK